MLFEEYIKFKIVHYLSHCGVYTCLKFRKSYTPPAARIRVNNFICTGKLISATATYWLLVRRHQLSKVFNVHYGFKTGSTNIEYVVVAERQFPWYML